jgi:hypothetical protein
MLVRDLKSYQQLLYIFLYFKTHVYRQIIQKRIVGNIPRCNLCLTGACGGVVVKELRYWSDGPGIDPRWCHLGFFPWFLPTKLCALRST